LSSASSLSNNSTNNTSAQQQLSRQHALFGFRLSVVGYSPVPQPHQLEQLYYLRNQEQQQYGYELQHVAVALAGSWASALIAQPTAPIAEASLIPNSLLHLFNYPGLHLVRTRDNRCTYG
jgi:hypothetical protein